MVKIGIRSASAKSQINEIIIIIIVRIIITITIIIVIIIPSPSLYPETRKYWVYVHLGIVLSHGVKDPL